MRRGQHRSRKGTFVSITTFKRDGAPVSVPVWCAADNGTLLVFSEADSWKVKRIRRDAHVRLAPCSARGTPRGPAVDADAHWRSRPGVPTNGEPWCRS